MPAVMISVPDAVWSRSKVDPQVHPFVLSLTSTQGYDCEAVCPCLPQSSSWVLRNAGSGPFSYDSAQRGSLQGG